METKRLLIVGIIALGLASLFIALWGNHVNAFKASTDGAVKFDRP